MNWCTSMIALVVGLGGVIGSKKASVLVNRMFQRSAESGEMMTAFVTQKDVLNRVALSVIVFVLLTAGFAPAVEPLKMRLRAEDGEPTIPEVRTSFGGIAQVTVPEMVVHLPKKEEATGMAVIVCPGGAYREVGAFDDGMGAVPYFVPKGVAVIVLKHRTRPPSEDVVNDALADAKRAVRLVRHHSSEWNIDPKKIGMIGSSAGSHLILNLGTHWDLGDRDAADEVERESCRPDFMALLCPWPNHQPVGDFPITKETPPMFIASAKDDTVAPIEFSKEIVKASEKNGVAVELWELNEGGHSAFEQKLNPAYQWPERLLGWLKKNGIWK